MNNELKNLMRICKKKALSRLRYIDAANKIDDLRVPPSNKLKKRGELK